MDIGQVGEENQNTDNGGVILTKCHTTKTIN